ncbi:hypothetical protein KXV52_003105, partial [Aspergillus fumigatus]
GWTIDLGRHGGQHAERRPEATHRHCAGFSSKTEDPAAGRGHVGTGQPVGGYCPRGHGCHPKGPDHDHGGASPEHRPERGCDLRVAGWQVIGDWNPRTASGQAGEVLGNGFYAESAL